MRLPTPVLARLLGNAFRGWAKDEIPRLGASLAYYTLLSLAPMLLIAIAVAGLVFGREAVRTELVNQIQGLIGSSGAGALQSMLTAAYRRSTGIVPMILGTLAFLGASLGAFTELQHALNTIFKVKVAVKAKARQRPWRIALVWDRLRTLGMVLVIGFLLLVSLAISAALAAASGWLEGHAIATQLLGQILNVVVSLAVITVLFALIYRFLPDVRLAWRDVWVGGLITSMLFTVGKQLIGMYLGRGTVASSYGAAGSVIVLLLWVYYSSQVVLLGAEFTRLYVEHRGKAVRPNRFGTRDRKAHPSAPGVSASR